MKIADVAKRQDVALIDLFAAVGVGEDSYKRARTLVDAGVDAVVVEPWGAHPSYAQGYYDRDNDFYVSWEPISRDPAALRGYLDQFVFGVGDRAEYLERCGGLERLRAGSRVCAGVNYGY